MKFSIYFCLILTFGQLQKNVATCPFRRVVKIIHNESFFFSLGFHSRTFSIHRHLEISRVIAAESSPLHIARTVAGFEPGTSGLRAQVANL